jgi:hypothetical protein
MGRAFDLDTTFSSARADNEAIRESDAIAAARSFIPTSWWSIVESSIWRGASVVDYDHLAASFVGLHDAVRLTDLVEAEDLGRLDIEPTGRVRGNLP